MKQIHSFIKKRIHLRRWVSSLLRC